MNLWDESKSDSDTAAEAKQTTKSLTEGNYLNGQNYKIIFLAQTKPHKWFMGISLTTQNIFDHNKKITELNI